MFPVSLFTLVDLCLPQFHSEGLGLVTMVSMNHSLHVRPLLLLNVYLDFDSAATPNDFSLRSRGLISRNGSDTGASGFENPGFCMSFFFSIRRSLSLVFLANNLLFNPAFRQPTPLGTGNLSRLLTSSMSPLNNSRIEPSTPSRSHTPLVNGLDGQNSMERSHVGVGLAFVTGGIGSSPPQSPVQPAPISLGGLTSITESVGSALGKRGLPVDIDQTVQAVSRKVRLKPNSEKDLGRFAAVCDCLFIRPLRYPHLLCIQLSEAEQRIWIFGGLLSLQQTCDDIEPAEGAYIIPKKMQVCLT